MLLKKSKLFSIIICIVTVLSLCSLIIPNNAKADGNDKSLTLVCISDDVILSGMKWKLYKVGERTSDGGNFRQTGDFAAFQVNLRRLTEERVNEAAQTLQSYAVANKLSPLREGQTNENGEIEFSGLDAGLYLVSGTLLKIDSHYYVPTTALVEIRAEDENLRYDAYPKFQYQVMNGQPRRYVAYKKWVGDEENIENRPKQIVVDIYKDEEYYDSVILNDENNWQYTWIDNEGASAWIVMEKDIPERYELNVMYDESRYILENSYVGGGTTTTTNTTITDTTNTTTTTTVSGSSATITTSVSVADNSVTNTRISVTTVSTMSNASVTGTRGTVTTHDNDDITTTTRRPSGGNSSNSGGGSYGGGNGGGYSNSGKLPQTGQLWWPVIPLSIGGVLLVGAGLVIRSKRKED